jgi:hypothetical protein
LLKTVAQQASIVINPMLLLFYSKIESNFQQGSTVAFMHGCAESNAAQEASRDQLSTSR